MVKTRISMKFDPELLRRIDQAARDAHLDRTAWVTQACMERLPESGRQLDMIEFEQEVSKLMHRDGLARPLAEREVRRIWGTDL